MWQTRLTTAEPEPGPILEEPALETETERRAPRDLGLSMKDKKEQEKQMQFDDTRDSRLTQDKIDEDTLQTSRKNTSAMPKYEATDPPTIRTMSSKSKANQNRSRYAILRGVKPADCDRTNIEKRVGA